MEQLLSVFGIDWKMLLVETVNFLILLGGLSYFLYRPVMKVLKERSDLTAKGVEDAARAALAAKESEEKKREIVSAAEREAEKIVSSAVVAGKDQRNEIVKKAQERSDTLLSDARSQADELQRRALRESEREVARMAILAAERILKES